MTGPRMGRKFKRRRAPKVRRGSYEFGHTAACNPPDNDKTDYVRRDADNSCIVYICLVDTLALVEITQNLRCSWHSYVHSASACHR